VSLGLDIDEHHVAGGPLMGQFSGLRFATGGIQVEGQGSFGTQVRVDLDHERASLADAFVDLSNVGMRTGKQRVENWWARAAVSAFSVSGMPPRELDGGVSVLAKSAEPLLKTLADRKEISGVIPKLTELEDLRIRATVLKRGDVVDVMMDPIETDLFDVAGRYHANGEDRRIAIVVGGKAVSLGIAKEGSRTTLKPLAHQGWLNEQLRRFPPPIQTVHSSQP
jgi:hypothetical protein